MRWLAKIMNIFANRRGKKMKKIFVDWNNRLSSRDADMITLGIIIGGLIICLVVFTILYTLS